MTHNACLPRVGEQLGLPTACLDFLGRAELWTLAGFGVHAGWRERAPFLLSLIPSVSGFGSAVFPARPGPRDQWPPGCPLPQQLTQASRGGAAKEGVAVLLGPREALGEHLASFLCPPAASMGSPAPQVQGWGLGAGARANRRQELCPSRPQGVCPPSPGPAGRLEHKAIFIYDPVSGLAPV